MSQALTDQVCMLWQRGLGLYYGIECIELAQFKPANSPRVHVVGSGASAVESIKSIKAGEPAIAANTAIALRYQWSVAFIEDDAHPKSWDAQRRALSVATIGYLMLKNNYPYSSLKRFDWYTNHYQSGLGILLESPFIGSWDAFAKDSQWLDGQPKVVRQFASSCFTMIMVALRYKPNEVVLHGIDFGGRSFYELPDFAGFDPGPKRHVNARGRKASNFVKPILLALTRNLKYTRGVSITLAHK